MRASSLILAFAPLIILMLLAPAFEASTFPNIIKGSVIGIYLSLSFIGLTQLLELFKN